METVTSEWVSPQSIPVGTKVAYTIFGAMMRVTKVTSIPSVKAVKIEGIRLSDDTPMEWFVPESTRFAI